MAVGVVSPGITTFFDTLYPSKREVAVQSEIVEGEVSYYKDEKVALVQDGSNNLHVRIRDFVPLEEGQRMQTLVARTARAVDQIYEHVKAEGIFDSFWVDICNLSQFDEVNLRSVVPRQLVNPIFPPAQREGSPPIAEGEDEGEAEEPVGEVGFVSFLSNQKAVHFWEWIKKGEPCRIKVGYCDCLDENMDVRKILPKLYSGEQVAIPNHALRYYFVESLIKNKIKELENIWGVHSARLKEIHWNEDYYKRHNDPEGFLDYLENFRG